MKTSTRKYRKLISDIGITLKAARQNTVRVINEQLVKAYWETGRHIVMFEQQGKERAEYGSELLDRLSRDLKLNYGKGFSRRNVLDMRRFYLTWQKWQAVPAKLSWTHIITLLGVSNVHARNFYVHQSLNEKWGYRELERQIDASLYERLALSKDKKGIMSLSKKGHIISRPEEIIKDPYLLNFLQIPMNYRVTEKELEQRIIDNLQLFLLEMGKGFTFVARQFIISLKGKHYSIDLVLYNRILKCFILVDLKTKKVAQGDIGQMNMYLNYFKKEENVEDDNEPMGIILSAEKDEVMVEYAMGGITNKIFVSKYLLYVPDKDLLKSRVKALLAPGLAAKSGRKK